MKRTSVGTTILLTALLVRCAAAETQPGMVAAMRGVVQVERAGAWQETRIGTPVYVGERLRTGPGDRVKIVFRDDSVLDLAANTEVIVEKHEFDAGARRYRSLFALTRGRLRAWISDNYRDAGALYEVETPTAVVAARGGQFIVVYSPAAEVSEVVGVAEQAEVASKLAVVGGSVRLGPRFHTEVRRGRFPTVPKRLDDVRFHEYSGGLDIPGSGRRDGLNVFHPAVTGQLLTTEDIPGGAAPKPDRPVEEPLVTGAPMPFLGQRLSPDVRANTQPLLEFKRRPPGVPPAER